MELKEEEAGEASNRDRIVGGIGGLGGLCCLVASIGFQPLLWRSNLGFPYTPLASRI
jgi:hypothetical protein